MITRPDPMTADEREAWLAAEEDEPFDPEEWWDPEGPPSPGEDQLTPEELAGIQAAAADELLALTAATTGRRGPGQPGSARVFPGEDRFDGVADHELVGVLCAWDRIEAHVAARKLAAIAELIRRSPGARMQAGRPGADASGLG